MNLIEFAFSFGLGCLYMHNREQVNSAAIKLLKSIRDALDA